MTIKHLVIAGGTTTGFCFYGALKHANISGFWEWKNIETIYATSVGTIIGFIISLNYDWETIDEYLIRRPWHHLFKIDINTLFQSISKCGVFDRHIIKEMCSPLLKGKNIDVEITLEEYYKIIPIELHFMTIEFQTFKPEDISWKTHPQMKLVDAIYASCCLPFLFVPFQLENKTYIDGGFFLNYPIDPCLDAGHDPQEILGLYRIAEKFENNDDSNKSEYSLFQYISEFLYKIGLCVEYTFPQKSKEIPHQLIISYQLVQKMNLLEAIHSPQERMNMIQMGVNDAIIFLSKISSSKNEQESMI